MLPRKHELFSVGQFILVFIFVVATVWSTEHSVCATSKKCEETCRTTSSLRSDFIGHYTFPTTPIKTLECRSEEATTMLEKAVPVVLKNCHFGDITQSWTFDYLKENMLSPNLTVYVSPTRRFLFYNSQGEKGNYSWTPPHNHTEMNFTAFLDLMEQLDKAGNGSKIYLQTSLEKEFLHSDMQDDVFMFNTLWVQQLKARLGWGRQDLSLFLVGMAGVVTPAHYDIMENLFLQVYGKKRCILFSPESYKYIYPYPLHHPHDRQTQVNFDSPDFEKFPKFRNISGVDAVLEPGDVLYIPNYWWHYIESEKNSKTISMNFWYLPKGDPDDNIRVDGEAENIDMKANEGAETTTMKEKSDGGDVDETERKGTEVMDKKLKMKENQTGSNQTEPVPLSPGELIGLSREIEEMIGNALGDVTKVGDFLKEMVEGRYDFV